MDPQQAPNNPYGFILDTQHQPKKSRIPKNMPKKNLFLLIGVGLIVVIILFSMISRTLFGNGDTKAALINVRAQQTELIRISQLGIEGTASTSTKNFAQTTLSSVTSEQVELSTLMAEAGIKVNPEELASRKNDNFEEDLDAAKKNNSFDDVLLKEIKAQLEVYKVDLSKAYDLVSTDKSKEILKGAHSSAVTLLE